MTKKSNEKLISEKIEWLRKRCTDTMHERTQDAALSDKPVDAETEAYREAMKSLQRFENYMIPDEEAG